MPFQSVPNCAEAVINGNIGGRPIANVLGFQHAGAYSQADIDNLAADVDSVVGTDYRPLFPSPIAYDNVHVRGLASLIDLEATNSTSAGNGTTGSSPVPANAALCVTLRTGFTGRSARGRFYAWPTDQSNLQDAEHYLAIYAAAVVTFLQNVQTAAAPDGWSLSIISRYSGGALRAAGVPFVVTSINYRNRDIDSMRRRLLPNH